MSNTHKLIRAYSAESETSQDPPYHAHTKELVEIFLKELGVPFSVATYSSELYEMCMEEAARRSCIMTGDHSISRYIPAGVLLATTAYGHLDDNQTRVYIALITALLYLFDDSFQEVNVFISNFNRNLISNKPQGNANFDALADLLRTIALPFDAVFADIMLTSAMNFITGLAIDHEVINNIEVLPAATFFPDFMRAMSGASDFYTVLSVPPNTPVKMYLQALPDISRFLDDANDVLSFFKEECAGETQNRISIDARREGRTKHSVMNSLLVQAVARHHRALEILAGCPTSLEAYRKFALGLILFHISLPRYRLTELLSRM